jgi:hypothetical protein
LFHAIRWKHFRSTSSASSDSGVSVRSRAHAASFSVGVKNTCSTRASSTAWFRMKPRLGSVILHHRAIQPVLIRPWSPDMDRYAGAIWMSQRTESRKFAELTRTTDCQNFRVKLANRRTMAYSIAAFNRNRQWRLALRMGEVQETAAGDGVRVYLRASASCDGVRVTITATVADLIDFAGSTEPPGMSE